MSSAASSSSPFMRRRRTDIPQVEEEEEELNAVFNHLPQLPEWSIPCQPFLKLRSPPPPSSSSSPLSFWSPSKQISLTPEPSLFFSQTPPQTNLSPRNATTSIDLKPIPEPGYQAISPISLSGQTNGEKTEVPSPRSWFESMPASARSSRSKRKPNRSLARRSDFCPFFISSCENKNWEDFDKFVENNDLRCLETLSDILKSSEITSDHGDVQSVIDSVARKRKSIKRRRRAVKKIKKKKKRHHLPECSVKVLREWMENHLDDPYATRQEKKELARSSGLHFSQVDNWLSNTRFKLKIKKCSHPSSSSSSSTNN